MRQSGNGQIGSTIDGNGQKQLPCMYSDHSVEPRDKVVCKKRKPAMAAMDLDRFSKSRLEQYARRHDGIGSNGGRRQGMVGKLMRAHKA